MPTNGDLTQLLGHNLLEGRALATSREYGLMARPGARAYESREAGVEVLVDDADRVTTVVLHFTGDNGFKPFQGMIPGRGGTIGRRSKLWAALGRPVSSGDVDEWPFPSFVMRAQYAPDGETLLRLVLGR
ncbi:hypothetical protein Ade02nite_12240 [Paractinoplanes deccanensis]|uniref:Uncharacterized protein n=1 Tax=Paractinoplanes deccanensis TaxID=113561 RepID=A0ABQ3XXU5_9ACTN|nr:hypothetical protein [Actinoplanes deccanensis]GID72583.1 hypothetical protein Ade02nite_12240 [Actinoplanes deccanensis]